MKETMKKFGAWLLAAALAFAGATTAKAADYTAANQTEFVEVAAKAVSGDRILLGEGTFAIGPVDIDHKTLTFKGAGETLTTVCIGNGGYDGNGGHGSNKIAKMTFEELTLDDLASDSGYLTGFTEAAGLTFRKVTFNVGFSNWGNKGGAVNFYDCTFKPVAVGKYNVQELRSASGTEFLFDGCVFNSAEGRFINAYKQGGAEAFIVIVVKDCTFKNTGSAGKCALNLKDSANGCTIALTFVGENKTEGEFPALDESMKSRKPSKLFETEGADNATVMFKATEEDNPVVIYANSMKLPSAWIDPAEYKLPGVAAEVEVVVPAVSEEKGITQEIVEQIAANPEVAKVEDTGLKAALAEDETLKDAEAVVKVELTKAAKDESGVLTFEIKPVVKGETETDISDKVAGKPITFRVPLTDAFTKFAKVTHKGTVDEISHVEVLGVAGARYVELTFNHFSEVEFDPELSIPGLPETAVKVADGFYQSGATYTASSDFYITSKAGLEYFRDLINSANGSDMAVSAGIAQGTNRFSGKTVNLLVDIDLGNEIWTPIGWAGDKEMFAGTFDGNNHVVSNLKTVYKTEGKDQAGLFGYSNKPLTIQNLTLKNVDITGYTYVGAIIATASNAGSQIVNCHVIGSVSITAVSSYVGGIVGHGSCSVSNCSVEATAGTGIVVTGDGISVGGIYGYAANNPGNITDCSVSGLSINLARNYVAGGIVGGVDRPLTVNRCSVEDVSIECQRGPYLGYVVGNIQGGDGILAVTDCTVKDSTLLSHVDKYTEKEETYIVQCGAHDAPTSYYVGLDVETDGNGKVVGGLYEWLPDGLVAPGYEKVAQGTTPETWVVQEKSVPVVPIAEIVGKDGTYTSLDDAILAAGADDVIQMLVDADVGDVMGAYKSKKGYAYKLPGNLTIDLNNHEVKLSSVALHESDAGGKLLFEDGKININGAMGVAIEANDASSVFYVGKQGTLEFNSVDIVGTDVAASVIFRTYTKNATLMRFDDCTITINGCNDFAHTVQRVEFEDTQVQIKNNNGRVFRDNDGNTNDGGSKVTLLRSSVSVDGISKNGGEEVNAIVLDASSLSFKNYQTESMGANKCNIELKNGSSFVLDGVGSHGFTNGKLVVNEGCTVDVKNVAYLGLNVADGSIFKTGSKVSVANCCTTTKTSMSNYCQKDIAMWSSGGSVVIENDADVTIDGRLIVKSGSLDIADGKYKKVELENGTLSLMGGIYTTAPAATYIAEGYLLVDNTDTTTAGTYPYAVVPAVAKIVRSEATACFATLEEAVASVQEGEVITVIGDTDKLTPPDGWEFKTDSESGVTTLVKKAAAVAEVIDASGKTTKFSTLAEAFAAAKSGETVKLLADVADIGTITLPAGVTIDGQDGETKHTITGASGFYIPEAGGCAIKNIQFVDIHNNSVWSEGDIASYGKDYGVSSGYVGTQSAIVATPLRGELEISGCYFDNIDWDAIQITGVEHENDAKIKIVDNEFRHTNATTAQLRYIHIESTTVFDTHPTLLITDNRFYDTKYSYPIANLGIWRVELEDGENAIAMSGNWFENTANVVVPDNTWLNPMRSKPDVDVDDKSFVAQIDQSGSIVIGQYFSVRDAVIAANKMGAEAKWSDKDDYINITMLAEETLSAPLVVNNVNGVKIKISASSYTLTANGCDLVQAKTPVYLSGRFACDTAGKFLIDVDEGATGQFSGSTEAKTCGSFNGSVVVEGPVDACFDSDITPLQSYPHFYGKWYVNKVDECTWQIVAYTDATAKDAGLPIKATHVTIDGISGTRYFTTLSDLSERATKFDATISLVGDVSLAEDEGNLPKTKTIELKTYTISGPVESAGSLTILSSSSTPNQTFDFIKTTDAGLTLGKSGQKYNTEAVIKDADIGTLLMIYRSFKKVTIEGGRYKSSDKVATLYTYSSEKSELVVKGGIFGSDQVYDNTGKAYLPLSNFVPEGYELVANPDEATKATYPWAVQEKATDVAEIFVNGESVGKYATLAEAFAAAAEQTGTVENPVVIQLMEGTIEEGEIKLPTTLKNVKMVGAANKATTIKNTKIMAADGGPWDYEGLTFEGVVYDNSQFVFTGWRAGSTCTAKDWAFIGNEFKDIVNNPASNIAALHLNFGENEPLVNLTFENNVIDGVTGSQCSGLYGIVSGQVVIRNNRIENCDYRAMNLMPATNDGIDDNVIIEDNVIRGNYYEVLCKGSGAASTDNVSWTVRYNIFDDDETADTLDLYSTNPAKTTYVLDHNYYVKNPDTNPGKFYLNGTCTADNIADFGVYPYYANYDKEALAAGTKTVRDSLYNLVELPVAQIGETKFYSINDAFAAVNSQSGDDVTIKILRDVEEELSADYFYKKNVTLDTEVEGGVTVDFKKVHPLWAIIEDAGSGIITISENVKLLNIGQIFAGYSSSGNVVNIYGQVLANQLWAYNGGTVNIYPSAKVQMHANDGMIRLRSKGTVNIIGNGKDEVQFEYGYFAGDGNGENVLNLKDTFVNACWLTGDSGAFTLNLDNAKLVLGHENLTGINFADGVTGTINMKIDSLIAANRIGRLGTINIDATGIGDEPVKVFDYTGSSQTLMLADYGTVNVTGGEAYVEDNDLWVKKAELPVCQIGDTPYPSIAKALEATPEGVETTITIIADHEVSFDTEYAVKVANGQNVIIDLNGHTISAIANRNGMSEFILNEGSLVITDTTEDKAGKITYKSNYPDPGWGYPTVTVRNHWGALTLNAGCIENMTVNGASYAVDNTSNDHEVLFTMNGGSLNCPSGDQALRLHANSYSSVAQKYDCRFVMHGGEITAGGIWLYQGGYSSDDVATVVIDGGTVNGVLDLGNLGGVSVNISGGVFNITKLRLRSRGSKATYTTISGGQFKIAAFDNQITAADEIPMNITGGLFDNTAKAGLADYVAEGSDWIANTDTVTSTDYPWTVGEVTSDEEIEIPVDESGEAVIPVKVPAEVFEQKEGHEIKDKDGEPLPTPTSKEEKQQFLVAEQPNGLKVWQNVAMGVDGNQAVNALATISREPTDEEVAEAAKESKTVDIVINTPISEFDPPTTTGVTVSYKLLRSTDGGVTWKEMATNLEKPEFLTWTKDDEFISEGDTFWKFQAVFTSQAN